ncbi:MAG: hypothetical protein U0452_09745 [Anaerolineae bacterium]
MNDWLEAGAKRSTNLVDDRVAQPVGDDEFIYPVLVDVRRRAASKAVKQPLVEAFGPDREFRALEVG